MHVTFQTVPVEIALTVMIEDINREEVRLLASCNMGTIALRMAAALKMIALAQWVLMTVAAPK